VHDRLLHVGFGAGRSLGWFTASVVNVEYWLFAVVSSTLKNRGHFDPDDLT
jgi:hypothetical protein